MREIVLALKNNYSKVQNLKIALEEANNLQYSKSFFF